MPHPLLREVRRLVEEEHLIARGDRVLVAVSGGPDSVALAEVLAQLGAGRWQLALAHVEHGLRGNASAADRRFVEKLATRLGLAVFVSRGQVRDGPNLEERAREIRYERLRETAVRHGFGKIAVGHTRDDQAETVLLHLLRGAGAGGLGAMSPLRPDGIVRPLLGCSREQTLDFLHAEGLTYRHDASNRDPRFTRNRIRRKLLPLLEREFQPRIRESLSRTADLLRADDAALETTARRALRRARAGEGLSVSVVSRLPEAIRRRVVRSWLEERRSDRRRLTLGHVEAILDLVRSGHDGGRTSVPGGTVGRDGDRLRWGEPAAYPTPFATELAEEGGLRIGSWKLRSSIESRVDPPCDAWTAVFDAVDLPPGPLLVRNPRPGDRIRPLGLGGTRKLQDVWVDARVARTERASWPVVTRGATILWIPGIVRGDVAPVHDATRKVRRLEACRIDGAGTRAWPPLSSGFMDCW